MRRRDEFTATVAGGARAGRPALAVHLRHSADGAGVRVGFVVTRATGSAVARNLVRRRLRHLMRERWSALAAGTSVVVRANAAALTTPYDELAVQLDRALARAQSRPARAGRDPR
jgi:ribonuclease P protein component